MALNSHRKYTLVTMTGQEITSGLAATFSNFYEDDWVSARYLLDTMTEAQALDYLRLIEREDNDAMEAYIEFMGKVIKPGGLGRAVRDGDLGRVQLFLRYLKLEPDQEVLDYVGLSQVNEVVKFPSKKNPFHPEVYQEVVNALVAAGADFSKLEPATLAALGYDKGQYRGTAKKVLSAESVVEGLVHA